MADKQQENGVISEALPQSQAGVAVAAEPNSSEPKSDQNSSNTPQKEVSAQKEVAKEPEKEAAAHSILKCNG